MSAACDLEQVESLAFDELPLDQARRALEHAGACGPCGLELAALRRERALFHARAAARPALPRLELFAKVEGAAKARALPGVSAALPMRLCMLRMPYLSA